MPTSDAVLLAAVRDHWLPEATAVVPLGDHGWRVDAGYRPTLHARLHTAPSERAERDLEDTLAATADLAFALDAVVPALPLDAGRFTTRLAGTDGVLACSPWVIGEPGEARATMTTEQAERTAGLLQRLHRVTPPRRLPRWQPTVDHPPTTPADLPAEFLAEVLAEHRRLLPLLDDPATDWRATHGAPDRGHQVDTPQRTLLVGWHGARLAPRERDLVTLVEAGHQHVAEAAGADPRLLRLMTLDRHLAAASG